MKLEIYDADKPEKKLPVFLKLKKSFNAVEVVVVADDGHTLAAGHLLKFSSDGSVHVHQGVDSTLGFDLDGDGRIKTK